MQYSAHAFVYTLLAGLLWLLVFDLIWGQPLHVTGGFHDHDLDGVPDDPRNAIFKEQDIAHNHQTGNVWGHPAEFDVRHPNHRLQ